MNSMCFNTFIDCVQHKTACPKHVKHVIWKRQKKPHNLRGSTVVAMSTKIDSSTKEHITLFWQLVSNFQTRKHDWKRNKLKCANLTPTPKELPCKWQNT